MMGWDIGTTGFDLVLARDIPSFVTKDFAPFCDAFLRQQGLAMSDLGQPACHPGGGRVVEALEDYFAPAIAGIPATREVLAQTSRRPILLTALGPGFTAALGILDPAGAA